MTLNEFLYPLVPIIVGTIAWFGIMMAENSYPT
jgi:hypothetical protein